MKDYQLISGGVDMYYQSTLVTKFGKRLLRVSSRKQKIKNILQKISQ